MPGFEGYEAVASPLTTTDNWAFDAAIDEYGEIAFFMAAGEVTTGAVVRGRVARTTGAPTAGVAGDVQNMQPHSAAAVIAFNDTWTTHPTVTAGAIIPYTFNANGGGVYLILPINERPQIVGAEVISCRNSSGTSAMSTAVQWQEP